MASGVTVSSDCIEKFQELKLKNKYKYITFTLNSISTEIIVDKVVDKTSKEQDYDEFLNDLPETECRWAVYDFEFEKEGGGRRSKISFISWSPDDAKVKQKMLFASSREALKRALTGLAVEIQGTDHSEVSYEAVFDKANRSA